ncbi:MAG: cation transporter [Candidatus Omnitrophica bacterium]|nr:cation transporter [Candidatus Omnitrophota bacterium]MDD5488506.1 cation transporter [Candidatus Omnitrophota bacterium]
MNTNREQDVLTFSACGALFFALLALIWGVLAKSQMIMFDGVYSFISLVMTGMYFYAAKSIAAGRDENFPFGKSQLEPMVIVVQSVILLVICTRAFTSATVSLFSSGQETNSLSGMAYAFIGVVGCFACWSYIARTGRMKAPGSELLKTQASQWRMDTLLSFAVLVGFFIGYLIQRAGYGHYSPYVDPLMVMIAVLFFVREPLVSLIRGIRGMLIMAPEKEIYGLSKKAVLEIARKAGFDDAVVRLARSGRELIYEVYFVAKDPESSYSVGRMDDIRNEVASRLHEIFDNPLWLNVSFAHYRSSTYIKGEEWTVPG